MLINRLNTLPETFNSIQILYYGRGDIFIANILLNAMAQPIV
jgi:hypothetical protein